MIDAWNEKLSKDKNIALVFEVKDLQKALAYLEKVYDQEDDETTGLSLVEIVLHDQKDESEIHWAWNESVKEQLQAKKKPVVL